MRSIRLWLPVFVLSTFAYTSCDDDEPSNPDIPNEEEVITSLIYELVPEGGGEPVTLSFQDLDGDGGNAPIIETDPLAANTNYEGSITLLNETEEPTEDKTAEINDEGEDHQFFFQTTVDGLTIAYDDTDSNVPGEGNPVGLSTDVSTGAAGDGTLTITLRHEPDKSAEGVANGDLANAGGETDIEVTFDVDVQ